MLGDSYAPETGHYRREFLDTSMAGGGRSATFRIVRRPAAVPLKLDLGLLSDLQRIVDIDPETPDGASRLGVMDRELRAAGIDSDGPSSPPFECCPRAINQAKRGRP